MKLQKFKENNRNQKGIIIFTIACVLLITGVFLYKTFASFKVIENEDLINGDVNDPGDIYFAFYKDNKIQKDMPTKEQGYVLDESKSYCGVTGGNDSDIKVHVMENDMIFVEGVTTSRTKCNLYFVKGAYILGKGIPTVTEGNGLYEVKHDGVSGTIKDEGFQKTEYRYAGSDPDNYIKFNDEDWRLIGLVNVMTSEETVEQRVKIIRKDSIQSIQWNSENNNDWNQSSLMRLLNTGDYYNREGDYETIGLTESAKETIDNSILWNLGSNGSEGRTMSEMYILERSNIVLENNEYLWKTDNHGVALMYPSDYGFATGGETEKRTNCISKTKLKEYSVCSSDNWLFPHFDDSFDWEWLLTPSTFLHPTGGYKYVHELQSDGNIWPSNYHVTGNRSPQLLRPTLYLKTNVKIAQGNGKSGSSYQLIQTIER